MPRLYQIVRWDETFENAKSRATKACHFVCLPNKQDGLGLTRILALPDGAAVFGVWCLIVQAASRQGGPRHGWLTEDGRRESAPWSVLEMALRWRRTAPEIVRALEVCANVGWLNDFGDVVTLDATAVSRADTAIDRGVAVVDGGPLKERKKEGREAIPTDRDTEPTPIDFESTPAAKPSPIGAARIGVLELRQLPGLKLTSASLPEWVTLANDVGLDVIRQARDELIAAGKECWSADVAAAAIRIRQRTAKAEAETRARQAEVVEQQDHARAAVAHDAKARNEADELLRELEAVGRLDGAPSELTARVRDLRAALTRPGALIWMSLINLRRQLAAFDAARN